MAGRDVKVSFKMTEEKKNELQAFANEYGVTMSSLVALVIGQWLYQQNNVVNPMVQSIGQVLKEQMERMVTDENLMAALVENVKEDEQKTVR